MVGSCKLQQGAFFKREGSQRGCSFNFVDWFINNKVMQSIVSHYMAAKFKHVVTLTLKINKYHPLTRETNMHDLIINQN